MIKLVIIYDSYINDKGRDSYVKAIKNYKGEHSKNVEIELLDLKEIEISQLSEYKYGLNTHMRVIKIEPIREIFGEIEIADIYDIEFNNNLPITTETILDKIEELFEEEYPRVMIINQSDRIGKSLATELVYSGCNVISLNSQMDKRDIEDILTVYRPGVLVTATGDEHFQLDMYSTNDIPLIIDLSNDTRSIHAIRHINTVETLYKRLQGQ